MGATLQLPWYHEVGASVVPAALDRRETEGK